nr:uncharacterized protein LOC115138811 [Oncorhynchus nerka]
MSLPDKYDRTPSKCRGYLLQCSLYFAHLSSPFSFGHPAAEREPMEVFQHYGLPEDIVSERGPKFTSRVWRAFVEKLGPRPASHSGTGLSPTGRWRGPTRSWVGSLGVTARSGRFPSLGGVRPELPSSLLHRADSLPVRPGISASPGLVDPEPDQSPCDEWFRHSKEVWNAAHVRLQRAVRYQKEQVDRHRNEAPVFHPGDCVWLYQEPLAPPALPEAEPPGWWFLVPWLMPSPVTPLRFPWTSMGPPPMPSSPYWTPDVMGVGFSTWWTGRGTVQKESCWVPVADILDPNIVPDFYLRHPERPAPCPRASTNGRSHPAAGAACCGEVLSRLLPLPIFSAQHGRSTNSLI